MTGRVLTIAGNELRILVRNKWVAVAAIIMIGFSLLIAFAGTGPVGTLGGAPLSILAASLSTLMVYLVPLIALLISFDAINGETARGTLQLLLTYPVRRSEIIAGKFLAHFILVSITSAIGVGAAALVFVSGGNAVMVANYEPVIRLLWTSSLLGAVFLAVGTLISAATKSPSTAAAVAIVVWIFAVVMYDVALLAAIVADKSGFFTKTVFPWLLVINPTDAFRLFNLSYLEAGSVAGGMAIASKTSSIPTVMPLGALGIWLVFALGTAVAAFRKVRP